MVFFIQLIQPFAECLLVQLWHKYYLALTATVSGKFVRGDILLFPKNDSRDEKQSKFSLTEYRFLNG